MSAPRTPAELFSDLETAAWQDFDNAYEEDGRDLPSIWEASRLAALAFIPDNIGDCETFDDCDLSAAANAYANAYVSSVYQARGCRHDPAVDNGCVLVNGRCVA